jgi:hypothetical protein
MPRRSRSRSRAARPPPGRTAAAAGALSRREFSRGLAAGLAAAAPLRGSQPTDDAGRVAFETIYPGWYPGRTTHVHFKVHVGPRTEATSQIYFPEDVTAAVYRVAPYASRGGKDTPNASDGVVGHGGAPALARVARDGAGLVATLVVAVAT